MFQTFEPVSDRSFAAKNLPLLRAQLKEQGLTGFLVPHDDEYQNEYIPDYAERLMWVSGFSGSAGAAIIFVDRAVIFTDGRYTLQVRQQTDEQYFSFEDLVDMPPSKWLEAHGHKDDVIGYDPLLHSPAGVRKLLKAAKSAGFTLKPVTTNPIDAAWTDQPAKPAVAAMPHPIDFAGEEAASKHARIGADVARSGADVAVITAPPSVCWLFNIRGGDVARTPMPLSRATITADGVATLYLDQAKVTNELGDHLGDKVTVKNESALEKDLAAFGQQGMRVAIDPALAPSRFVDILTSSGATVVDATDPCALPRAAKNSAEIDGTRAAHIRDGAAVTRYLHWLEENAKGGAVDEIKAASVLEEFRRETGQLIDLSFDSISGSGPNGAICHYRVTTQTNRALLDGELFLIDSGAQYRDGTTDITRTVPIGTPTAEMRDRFTRVLKGHIALATARFPKGTTGHQLDALARRPLWEAGLDYDHGTGHGVGSFLGVHEGPQRIAKGVNDQALLPGMILSNEPGFYKAEEFGIRIENLIVVSPATPVEGGEREMMSFETITLAPISLDLVVPALLDEAERHWLNKYHARVRQTLLPIVPPEISGWLKQATRSI